MSKQGTLFDELKARGEEFFNRVSSELMSNPNFTRAMQAAWKGKEKLDQAVGQALKTMNIPTRGEFNRAMQRIAELEAEVERIKTARSHPTRSAPPGASGARRTTRSSARSRGGAGGGAPGGA